VSVIRKLTTHWGFKVDSGKVKAFATSVDSAKENVTGVNEAVGKLGQKVRTVGKYFAAFGAAMIAGLVLPALKFEDSLKNTMTMVTATGKEFDDIEKGLGDLGIKFSEQMNMSAESINEGFYQVLSTGAEALTADFMELSEIGLKLAKVGSLMPSDAIEKLSDTTKGLNIPMTQAGLVADKLFRTTQLAATNLPQLTAAMREAGPVTGAYNMKMEETLGILGLFAAGGIKGSEAGTAFKMVVAKLTRPTGEAAYWIDKLGVSIYDQNEEMRSMPDVLQDYIAALKDKTTKTKAAALGAIMGERASSKFMGLLSKSIPEMREWIKQLEKAGGALDIAFNVKMSSGLQKLGQLKQKIVNTAKTIGTNLIPKILELADAFTVWFEKNQKGIEETAASWINNIGDMISFVVEYKEALKGLAFALGVVFATGKVVAFQAAAVAAFTAMGGTATAAAGSVAAVTLGVGALIAALYIATDLLDKAARSYAKSHYQERENFYRRRSDETDMKTMARLKKGLDDKSVWDREKALKRLNKIERRFGLGESVIGKDGRVKHVKALSAAEKSAAAKDAIDAAGADAGGAGPKEYNIGDAEITGAEKLKSKIEKELSRIFAPGFSKDLKIKFQQFLMDNNFMGRSNPLAAMSTAIGRDVSPQSMGGGDQMTIHRPVTYNIEGSDPKAIADEIERRERRMASDFGVGPISMVKPIP